MLWTAERKWGKQAKEKENKKGNQDVKWGAIKSYGMFFVLFLLLLLLPALAFSGAVQENNEKHQMFYLH